MGLESLEPLEVWHALREIYSKPPKRKISENQINLRIKNWLIKRSKENGIKLTIKEDKIGNILIKKSATAGMENSPSLLLQAHYDILLKLQNFEFTGTSINIQDNNRWFDLIGTPIFDDSVVGVALICSILVDNSGKIAHGPLEVLFTVKKDGKFVGVLDLDVDYFEIKSKLLLNFDSVDLGAITTGTAGCAEFVYSKKFELIKKSKIENLIFYELEVSGLRGGELGTEIHFFRGNAIKIIARCLSRVNEIVDLYLSKWNGGNLSRFIPRKSSVKFAIPIDQQNTLEKLLNNEKGIIIKKYKTFTEFGQNLEPDLSINLKNLKNLKKSNFENVFTKKDSKEIISLANLIPHGLHRSSSIENEFGKNSNNFAKVETIENKIQFYIKSRGDKSSEFKAFNRELIQLGKFGNWNVVNDYIFPVWESSTPGPFVKFVKHSYEDILRKPIRINKIYWTLELGVIGSKIKDIQIVSIGPTEIGVYPENYKVKISDIQVLYHVLKKIVRDLPQLSS